MRAAIGGLLLRSPDHTALHRRSRAARFASLMLTLQTFDTLFLESALPFRDCGRARAQPPFDLTIAQAIGQCQNEPGPENVPGRQTTRLRPSLQFIALFITELQCLIVSHSIMTLQSCCMFQWDRPLVDENLKLKQVLKRGEEKSLAMDRVVLIPGPPEEIDVVNEVFRLYALKKWSTTDIAKRLNERGIPCVEGQRWTRCIVRYMVTNPKYIGSNVMNRLSGKLGSRRVSNSPEMWIRKDHAFPGIVDPNLYEKAQLEAEVRSTSLSDKELLDRLRRFLKRHRKVSERILRDSPGMPCGQVYADRFGGLGEAYKLVGYRPYRNLAWVERDRPLVQIRRDFIACVVDTLKSFGASVQ